MVYTPTKHPKKAFIIITIIAAAGILGSYFISKYFMTIALIYWMQYTAVLSYLQFRRKSRHKFRSFTEYMLHPQARFFIFEFMAVIGIGSLLIYDTNMVGALALGGWWLFSLNFYKYYRQFKKYEE